MNIQKSFSPSFGPVFLKKALRQIMRVLPVLVVASVGLFSLSACDLAHNYLKPDRSANLEMQDYRDALAERQPDAGDSAGADSSIPGLQPYISQAGADLKPMPLVSVSVNQSVPLRDILYDLAQQAGYDIELDPSIHGSIIFTANNKPLDQVVAKIADLAGLRYEFSDDNSLHVEMDTPYNKLYKVDYLSSVRKTEGTVSNNISIDSSGDAGSSASGGSNFSTSSSSQADFWGELDKGLTQILGVKPVTSLATKKDPKISVATTNPTATPAAAGAPAADGSEAPADGSAEGGDATVNVSAIPEDTSSEEEAAATDAAPAGEGAAAFSINQQAGVINVFATQKQHKEVQTYLDLLQKSVTAQVLIEAKILEVDLNDQYATGIDWRALHLASGNMALNFLNGGASNLNALADGTGASLQPSLGSKIAGATNLAGDSSFVVGYAGNDIQALIKAISNFGTVHALASPRLTVLNNQAAVLNVADNIVYFTLETTRDVAGDNGAVTITTTSTSHQVPQGILVNVMPSINLDNDTVSLAVRPTVTRIIDYVTDPASVVIAQGDSNLLSKIPEMNVQQMDSVIQARSGQPVVMGGLIQDRTDTVESGVPVLNEIPMVGNLFRTNQSNIKKSELVIFLKATILNSPSDSIHNTDKDLYRMFAADRRPLKL